MEFWKILKLEIEWDVLFYNMRWVHFERWRSRVWPCKVRVEVHQMHFESWRSRVWPCEVRVEVRQAQQALRALRFVCTRHKCLRRAHFKRGALRLADAWAGRDPYSKFFLNLTCLNHFLKFFYYLLECEMFYVNNWLMDCSWRWTLMKHEYVNYWIENVGNWDWRVIHEFTMNAL